MRNHLIFMEILVMVLVFSLAAGACLGIFAAAKNITEETARLDRAVMLARNTAQLLKAGRPPETADTGNLILEISELPSGVPGVKQVKITVTYENIPVFSLNTGWQERMR